MRDDASDKTEYDTYLDDDDDDPMAQLRKNPTVRNLVTVTFTRDEFLKRLDTDGLAHPTATYRMFDAEMDVDGKGALKPIDAPSTFVTADSHRREAKKNPNCPTFVLMTARRSCSAVRT